MNIPGHSGGFLKDKSRYREWRKTRLQSYPESVEEILVPIDGLRNMTATQKAAIEVACRRSNMAIYQCRDPSVDRAAIVAFASEFGLTRLDHHLCANADGVSELSVASAVSGRVTYLTPVAVSVGIPMVITMRRKGRSMRLSCIAHKAQRPVVKTPCLIRRSLIFVCVMRIPALSRPLSILSV